MEQQTILTTHSTIEEVRTQLENWRKNKINHREPIPKELWQAAVDIARCHSINTVSKALRISYADLKNRVYPSKYKPTNKEKASFIELKYSSPLLPKKSTELKIKRDAK